MRLTAPIDTLIFIILHRCDKPERTGSSLLVALRRWGPEEEVFRPSCSHLQEFSHSFVFCLMKMLPQQKNFSSDRNLFIRALGKVTNAACYSIFCSNLSMKFNSALSLKGRSVQFSVMSLNKSAILRGGATFMSLPHFFNLALLINTRA